MGEDEKLQDGSNEILASDKPKPLQQYTSEMIDQPQANASQWQRRLFMIGIIVTLSIFVVFVWATINQINNVQSSIDNAPILSDSALTASLKINEQSKDEFLVYKNLVLLENQTIKKRYHNANVILKAQIYIKYLGFLTGMILSILGAIFILGKFREYPIDANTSGGLGNNFRLQLQSTSPGIFLSFIGAIIMMTTILNKTDIHVNDGVVYLNATMTPQVKNDKSEKAQVPKPDDFDDSLSKK